jgi:hypothetical protein
MQSFNHTLNHLVTEKPSHLVLGIFFIIYILLNIQTPAFLAKPIDTMIGKVAVVALASLIFMTTNPVVGVLGFVVAYQLVKTSSVTTGTYAMKHFLPSEESRAREMKSFNNNAFANASGSYTGAQAGANGEAYNNPVNTGTLEEEMVAKMAPLVVSGAPSTVDYQPILDGQHDAALLSEMQMEL